MKKIFRTLALLASFALTSALFAGIYNMDLGAFTAPGYVTPDQGFYISMTGSGDWINNSFVVINTDTNQEILAVGFMHVSSGWVHYVDSSVTGVTVTVSGTDTCFTGLPEGNYIIRFSTGAPGELSVVAEGGLMQLPTLTASGWDPDYGYSSVQFSGYVY